MRRLRTTHTPRAATLHMRAPMVRKQVKRTPKNTGRSKTQTFTWVALSSKTGGDQSVRRISIRPQFPHRSFIASCFLSYFDTWITPTFGFRLDCFFAFAIGHTVGTRLYPAESIMVEASTTCPFIFWSTDCGSTGSDIATASKSGKGGKGGTVKSRKQAIAIGLSEAREKGKKVRPKKK
jgi:Family of unknown function (DUF6496)